MIEYAIKVVLKLRRQLNPRHAQEARFFAAGRALVLPAILFSR
jgi:hypothetical protein